MNWTTKRPDSEGWWWAECEAVRASGIYSKVVVLIGRVYDSMSSSKPREYLALVEGNISTPVSWRCFDSYRWCQVPEPED